MSEEVNYKDSKKLVGELYPVLVSNDGEVIDGFHRLAVDPNWKREVVKDIDSEEKLLVARAISNWHRRQVSREEKEQWINGLAELYKKQGLTVGNRGEPNQIVNRLLDVTGLNRDTVIGYLDEQYKQVFPTNLDIAKQKEPKIPASERIEHELGPEYVERHREEVKEELLKNPEFITEVITKAPEILRELPQDNGTKISEEQLTKTREAFEESEKELKQRRSNPELVARSELVKNWMAHTQVSGLSPSLKCPICQSTLENLVWKCHDISVLEAHNILRGKLGEKQ